MSLPSGGTGRRSGLPLPARAYVPQANARHPEGAFDAIRDRASAITRTETAAENIAWLHGLDLLEAGFYWEAHEVLEAVWLNAPPNTPERAMVRAIIQLANAALKLRMGRPKAALRLCDMSRALVREAMAATPPGGSAAVMALPRAAVETQIEAVRKALNENHIPTISLSGTPT